MVQTYSEEISLVCAWLGWVVARLSDWGVWNAYSCFGSSKVGGHAPDSRGVGSKWAVWKLMHGAPLKRSDEECKEGVCGGECGEKCEEGG